MKKIQDQSIKNILTQGEYWGKKPKDLWNVIDEKPPNLQVGYCKEENRKEIE